MNILITAGGTREPIDGVRALSNLSTGGTGVRLAGWFLRRGHRVTLLLARSATILPGRSVVARLHGYARFDSALDLRRQMKSWLAGQSYDTVLHLAAVSDFRVAAIRSGDRTTRPGSKGKIDSSARPVLELRRNPKIVNSLKRYARNRRMVVVAFKLTNTRSIRKRVHAVGVLSRSGGVDLVLHNDGHEIDRSRGFHRATLYRSLEPLWTATTHHRIAQNLESTIKDWL